MTVVESEQSSEPLLRELAYARKDRGMEKQLQDVCVGIDVAKRHWEVAIAGHYSVRRFMADAAGLAELIAWLEPFQGKLVCLEATAGYERALRESLHQRNIDVSVVNPRQIRDFARSIAELEPAALGSIKSSRRKRVTSTGC